MRKTVMVLVCLIVVYHLFFLRECLADIRQTDSCGKDIGVFVVSFYDNCKACCGKDESHQAYGITASGERARRGYAACNWLPFGTVLKIEGLGMFTVKDRGAKRLFGTPKRPVKRIDVWVASHDEAQKLGIQIRRVALLSR